MAPAGPAPMMATDLIVGITLSIDAQSCRNNPDTMLGEFNGRRQPLIKYSASRARPFLGI